MILGKVFFKNSKNQKICGVIEETNSLKEEIVILVHGYCSSKDGKTVIKISKELSRRNINSFRVDLDGCGESEGNFADQTISNTVDDITSAIKFIKKRGYHKIDLFGSSAGGLTVMATALKFSGIHKIALKAPVSDFPTLRLSKEGQDYIDQWKEKGYNYYISTKTGQKLKVNYSFYEDSKNYVMYDKVKDIRCPVLIIHGDADEAVPLEQSQKVIRNFPNGNLTVLKGADHALEIKGNSSQSEKLFGDWFEGKEVK